MFRRLFALTAVAACIAAPGLVRAEVHEVEVHMLTFEPADITIQQGDTVRWVWVAGVHTVTSGEPCTPDGMFNEPIDGANPTVEIVFDGDPGVVDYFCIPHCELGMVGTVTVDAGPTDVPDALPAGSAMMLSASPNPMRSSTVVRFALEEGVSVSLSIFDAAGRRVAGLADGAYGPGTHAIAWDGRAADGRRLPSGVYYARGALGATPVHTTLILLR